MKYRVWSIYARVLSLPLPLSMYTHTHTHRSKCYCGNICTLINEGGKEGKGKGSSTHKILEGHRPKY